MIPPAPVSFHYHSLLQRVFARQRQLATVHPGRGLLGTLSHRRELPVRAHGWVQFAATVCRPCYRTREYEYARHARREACVGMAARASWQPGVTASVRLVAQGHA
jgi:hypothetical protein